MQNLSPSKRAIFIFWSKITCNVLKQMKNQFPDFFTIFKCFYQNWKKKSQKICNILKLILSWLTIRLTIRYGQFYIQTVNRALTKNQEKIFPNLIQTLTSKARVSIQKHAGYRAAAPGEGGCRRTRSPIKAKDLGGWSPHDIIFFSKFI